MSTTTTKARIYESGYCFVLFSSYFAAKARWGGPIRSPTVSGYRVFFFILIFSFYTHRLRCCCYCMHDATIIIFSSWNSCGGGWNVPIRINCAARWCQGHNDRLELRGYMKRINSGLYIKYSDSRCWCWCQAEPKDADRFTLFSLSLSTGAYKVLVPRSGFYESPSTA
jgi:hypothetical protein